MAEAIPIAVFARAPVPGAVKTRLVPRLGAVRAAEFHAKMVRRALATAVAAAVGPVILFGAPEADHPFFAECAATFGVSLRPQAAGDLGQRMGAVFAARRPALLIGADCPALEPRHLRAASEVLHAGDDAVFLPAEDGGYVLIGLQRPVPEIFEGMAWGTGEVMAETRRRLARLGLAWSELTTLWDVDRPEDLDRLRASGLMPEADLG